MPLPGRPEAEVPNRSVSPRSRKGGRTTVAPSLSGTGLRNERRQVYLHGIGLRVQVGKYSIESESMGMV